MRGDWRLLSYDDADGLVRTEMKYEYSEIIPSTPFCIDYVFLVLLEDEVKESDDLALGETADFEYFIGLYLKDDEVPTVG